MGEAEIERAANCTPAGLPRASDNAVINPGTVTLTTDVTVAGLQLSGTLSGDFDFWVTNLMTVNGGSMMGAGVTRIVVGATLRLNGTILRTSDGNSNWITQTSGTSNMLSSVSFTDANSGWAVIHDRSLIFGHQNIIEEFFTTYQ